MNIALWVLQSVLAFAFLAAGSLKITKSKADLVQMPHMKWANDVSAGQIKLIGLCEILGAVGLILPRALGIAPILTPIAAAALVLVMLGAVLTHVRLKESPAAAVILGILSAVVAAGRFPST